MAAVPWVMALGLVVAQPAGASGERARAELDAVLAAALGGVADELLTDEVQATGAVACLRVDPETGASESAADAVEARPFHRAGSECESRSEGAFEISTGAPAFVITAVSVEWIHEGEAHVVVLYRRSGMRSTRRQYRVVREPAGWVCLGQIIRMSPMARAELPGVSRQRRVAADAIL